MTPLISSYIRPQLVPFLFKELEGTEASYMSKEVKSIAIHPSSSLGKYLQCQMPEETKLKKKDKFIIYLTVEKKRFNIFYGLFYIEISKVKEPLMLSEASVNNINYLIEDMFRIGFIYYVDGSIAAGKSITHSIDSFIDKYDLLEVGFSNNNLRTLYYREKKKDSKLSRMQFHSSNRVMNYEKTM
jgi:hypothetical protein